MKNNYLKKYEVKTIMPWIPVDAREYVNLLYFAVDLIRLVPCTAPDVAATVSGYAKNRSNTQ